jgi:hypothetical protein
VVQPGDWEFTIAKTRDDELTWRCRGRFNVLPGTKVEKAIVCPRPQPVDSAVKVRVVWPADLARKDLRLVATFVSVPTTFQPALSWTLGELLEGAPLRSVLCGPQAVPIAIGAATKLELWHYFNSTVSTRVQSVFGDFSSHAVRPQSDSIAMETGSYALKSLTVMRPNAVQNAANTGQRFRVIAHTQATELGAAGVDSYIIDPATGGNPLGSAYSLKQFRAGVTVPSSYWRHVDGRFVSSAGKVNEWVVPLPEELMNIAREEIDRKDEPEPARDAGGRLLPSS